MAVELEKGSSVAGLLVDGVEETPYTGATLNYGDEGVRVAVPFIHGYGGQFAHVDEWFDPRHEAVPTNMLLEAHAGHISLFDVRWSRTSFKSSVSEGVLHPTNTVLALREAPLGDPLLVKRMRSSMDGLREFTRTTAISRDAETDEMGRVQKLTITIASAETVSWKVGDATLTLDTTWQQVNPEDRTVGGFTMLEWTTLTSEFPEPQPVERHIEVQTTLQRFLTCAVFERGIYYRRHQVSDETFPERIGREDVHYPFRELISRHTTAQFARKRLTYNQLKEPLLRAEHIGADGLERWASEQEKWEPFIAPLLQLYNRLPTVPEDFVVFCSIAMEHAGNIIKRVAGEKPTYSTGGAEPAPATATWMYRCIKKLGVDWSNLGTNEVGIAKAIAKQYNGTKHYKKNKVEAEEALYLTAQICRVVVRLFSLWIADQSGALNAKFGQYHVDKLHQQFLDRSLMIDDDGVFKDTGVAAPQMFV